ncbi:DUF998 domain-containing protein [Candidatus Saccharibacteria bacterium]|nr:DUF998 domain-containing protein [Candidatus Saccharibacteria bacterium]
MQLRRVRIFTDKYPWLGPLLWILSVQYFVNQIIVARAVTVPFSLTANTISDLGATSCGLQAGRMVCSPLHSLMNSSFIALGITMALGAVLLYHEFKATHATGFGFGALAVAGVGTLIVGLSPENVNTGLHQFGAALPFLLGNLGVAVLGFALVLPRGARLFTITSGIVPLVALTLYVLGIYLGLGIGGMERVVAYPQTIWLIWFGWYMSKNRYEVVRRNGGRGRSF